MSADTYTVSRRGRTGDALAFVGADRRRGAGRADLAPVYWGGLAAVVAVTVALAPIRVSAGRAHDLESVLDTVGVTAAVAVWALCWSRWRLVGGSSCLWAGTATLVVGIAAVGGPGVIGPVALGRPAAAHSALAEAGLVVAALAMAAGAFSADVDTRVRPVRLIVAAAAAVVILAPVFAAVAGAGLTGAVAAAWLGLVVVFTARGLRTRWRDGWCVVLALSLFVAQVSSGVTTSGVRAAGLLAAVLGCAVELGHAYFDQRTRLFDSQLSLETAAVEERLEAASERSRRHAVRNAVVAVEGAAVTLERHVDRLSADDRASLARVLSAGVERLQRLLGDDAQPVELVDLGSLAATVAGQLEWAERIHVAVPAGLAGTGSSARTSEVVRILLANANQRAPGGAVDIDGGRDGDWVVLRVHDRGPGLTRQGRRAVTGGDLGFLVVARLMRDQGGDAWVESLPDGGATFALCLPAAQADAPEEAGASGG